MKLALNAWQNKEKHVDETINEKQFLSSSRVIIYASADVGDTTSQKYQEFKPIGVIQGYSWSEQRQIDLIFELGSEVPYLVPGRTTGQISLSRILLSGIDLLNVVYGNRPGEAEQWIKSLKDVTTPMNLLFVNFSNITSEDNSQRAYSRLFEGCWITSRNESISAGQTVVAENCSIMYRQISDYEPPVA